MISIRRVDVPEYLRTGDWFEALDPDDVGAFEVPADCFKASENVHTKEDLFYLLQSLQYWQVQDIPMSATAYVYHSETFDVSAEFPVFSSWLENLRTVKEAIPKNKISVALQTDFRMEMIRWLHENSDCELCAEVFAAAACADDVESLAYLHECGCPWDAKTTKEAIISDSIECLKHAQAHGCPALPAGENPVNLAARKGHIDMIKHLRNSGEQWDENTLNNSQGAEGLACTQYLHEAGCPWKEDFCMHAALRGRLDCLRYAHEHGCPWDASVVITAVSGGNLQCVQYAHEHGCPWHAHVTLIAAQKGEFDCMKYAHEHGCPWHDRTTSAAFYMDNWRCMYYAVVHGASYAAVVWFIVLVIGCVLFFSIFAHYAYELYCGDITKRRLVLYCTVLLFQLTGLAPWAVMMTVGSESSVRVTVEQLVYWLFFCELISSTNLMYVLYLRHFHHAWLWGEE